MLELKKVVTTKTTVNDCIIEKSSLQSVKVKTVKQERTFQKRYLQSVYHLDSMYINVKHENGRNGRIDVYALAFYCVFKTLRKATTKRALELFDCKYSSCVHDWQDMIMTGVDYMLFGYVDGNGKYHKGYYTDRVSNIKELTGVIFSAVNSVIYAKGVTGKWTGVEVLTDDFAIVKDVTNIFGYVASGTKSVNADRYNQFISDIKKRIKSIPTIKVFDCITDGTFVNSNGTFKQAEITKHLGYKSTKSVIRAIRDIRDIAEIIVSNYNMTTNEFIKYLKSA